MITLTDFLADARESLGPDAEPPELASLLLSAVLSRPDADELLHPLVFRWVQRQERDRVGVRDLEKKAFPPGHRPDEAHFPVAGREASYVNPAQRAIRDLLDMGCRVPGMGYIPWGQMTAEMHRLHIEWLEGQVAAFVTGTRATIKRHEMAVVLLDESGCADLNQWVAENGELPGLITGEVVQAPA